MDGIKGSSTMGIMLETPTMENSVMVAAGSTMMVDLKKGGIANMEKKGEGVWCTFSNKPLHTRDKYCMESHLVEIGDPNTVIRSGEQRETTLERADKPI
ncbi:hypothetical protein LR48_Vigan181s001900 [Vigna angularis]|uniref:Uncharacterized protein n=1 Tax=Phaseolus angularis TaxID=3914 RepID=A0A0L9T5V2_PHAAN|nr:hypothetical protein LR48_Vigan181s001900 [Vigna angularis]